MSICGVLLVFGACTAGPRAFDSSFHPSVHGGYFLSLCQLREFDVANGQTVCLFPYKTRKTLSQFSCQPNNPVLRGVKCLLARRLLGFKSGGLVRKTQLFPSVFGRGRLAGESPGVGARVEGVSLFVRMREVLYTRYRCFRARNGVKTRPPQPKNAL